MPTQAQALKALIDCGKQFYDRRWMWGTAGNLSVKVADKPLQIAITPSGLNKGHLTVKDLLVLQKFPHPHPLPPSRKQRGGGRGSKGEGILKPSAETTIHQAIYEALPGAGAVFHVHPIFSTIMSRVYGDPKMVKTFTVEWFEMMKGVGVGEEETAEVAVFPNWQDVSLIARDIQNYIREKKGSALPVVLIYNHGLTAWGHTPDQARNHLEIMEYVCQYLYLRRLAEK